MPSCARTSATCKTSAVVLYKLPAVTMPIVSAASHPPCLPACLAATFCLPHTLHICTCIDLANSGRRYQRKRRCMALVREQSGQSLEEDIFWRENFQNRERYMQASDSGWTCCIMRHAN